MPEEAWLRRGSMKRILVAPREGHQIGYELVECMTSLENAGIRDYSARLERYIMFWVVDQLLLTAVVALADAGFKVAFSGGTSQRVDVAPVEENLHYAWDDAVVTVLEKQLEADQPKTTARKLEALYPAGSDLSTWKPGESERIAWESHQLAETDVYRPLGIPERPCNLHSCDPATSTPVR